MPKVEAELERIRSELREKRQEEAQCSEKVSLIALFFFSF